VPVDYIPGNGKKVSVEISRTAYPFSFVPQLQEDILSEIFGHRYVLIFFIGMDYKYTKIMSNKYTPIKEKDRIK